jgi:beta-phosphoglucomutase-like phosphatase (HAD superfamily)
MYWDERPLDGVIFDMDGVLLDSMPMWDALPVEYLQAQGITPPEDLARVLFPMTVGQACAYLADTFGLSQGPDAIAAELSEDAARHYAWDIPLKPGADAFTARLIAAGIPMAVATVTDGAMAAAALERLGILRRLKGVFSAEDYHCAKDSPTLYLAAARALAAAPGRTLVIEDALHGVRVAGAAGFVTCGIFDAASADDQAALKETADFYIESWDDALRRLHFEP